MITVRYRQYLKHSELLCINANTHINIHNILTLAKSFIIQHILKAYPNILITGELQALQLKTLKITAVSELHQVNLNKFFCSHYRTTNYWSLTTVEYRHTTQQLDTWSSAGSHLLFYGLHNTHSRRLSCKCSTMSIAKSNKFKKNSYKSTQIITAPVSLTMEQTYKYKSAVRVHRGLN